MLVFFAESIPLFMLHKEPLTSINTWLWLGFVINVSVHGKNRILQHIKPLSSGGSDGLKKLVKPISDKTTKISCQLQAKPEKHITAEDKGRRQF